MKVLTVLGLAVLAGVAAAAYASRDEIERYRRMRQM